MYLEGVYGPGPSMLDFTRLLKLFFIHPECVLGVWIFVGEMKKCLTCAILRVNLLLLRKYMVVMRKYLYEVICKHL